MNIRLLVLFLLLFTLSTCQVSGPGTGTKSRVARDLDVIRDSGKLVAVTDYNSTTYFLYKGEPMGFNFELLENFAAHLGLELEIIPENNLEKAFSMLGTGEADILAFNLTINSARKELIKFTEPVGETRQVLVQRKPRLWRNMTLDAIDGQLVRNQLDLAGKAVYVQKSSSHALRLKNLSMEIGDSIGIIEVPSEAEALIRLVAEGEIDYAVVDENIALVNSRFYPAIDIATPVSFPQKLAWGVRRKNSDKLLSELNSWLVDFRKTTEYALLYNKYYRNSYTQKLFVSDYYTLSTGKISPWDEIIKSYSDSIGWDWRLLSSLVYQESRFIPNVESWAGAYGLMQIMPSTAETFGIDVTKGTDNNIRAGIKYIGWLEKIYSDKIADKDERLKFILGSYNAGPGHVLDARRLALKNGYDPDKWDGNVAYFLEKKSLPEYYLDPVVDHGYCRGEEPVNYVSEILRRYEHYKNIIPEPKILITEALPASR